MHQNLKEAPIIFGDWKKSVTSTECTLHQLSPYIGKMKSLMASKLIQHFSNVGDTIYDPFVGCGTIALESWILGRHIVANDLSPYALVLTKGKLDPLLTEEKILKTVDEISSEIEEEKLVNHITNVPLWVRDFFNETTLNEIIVWKNKLIEKNEWFLLSCLLGILHHQRPGFLSYPSSHTVPYLRDKKFPKILYPELYEYRNVQSRLEKKALRAIKRIPELDGSVVRSYSQLNSEILIPKMDVDLIISSPPYMRRLDYGRDNRLRLWVVGETKWKELDKLVSQNEENFLKSMKVCFQTWLEVLPKNGKCILVFDNSYSKKHDCLLVDKIVSIACDEVGGYVHIDNYIDNIPVERRVRRNYVGSKSEIIVALQKSSNS